MKIIFIADVSLEKPASGSEQVLHHQAIGLAREGMDVYAITRQTGSPSWIIRNVSDVHEGCFHVSVQDMTRSLFSLVKYPLQFYRRFRQDTPFQAAISHQPLNCFLLLIMRKLRSTPLLYVFHSPSHEEYLLLQDNRSQLRNLSHAKIRQIIERFCLKRALKVMVLSQYMKQKLVQVHGIVADRIIVNPGGVDLDRFQPPQNRELLKTRLGFPAGKIHLLTVRNLEPRMGLDNLLKCIHILKETDAAIHLTLGGEGIERQNLENLIVEYGLSDEVTMPGFISAELLPHYYGAADLFILPTRHLEGFGLVTPESMACGTPVLGTPVGGTKEILSNFYSQFLFRDASPEAMAQGIQMAISEYFAQNEKYDKLRDRSRTYAENNYSWQRHIEQLKLILNEVIGGRRALND